MKTINLLIVVATISMTCNSNKPFIEAGKVTQMMWQEDTCGIHGHRANLLLSLNAQDFYMKNFKKQKAVVKFFGPPDIISESKEQISYLYVITSTQGCRGMKERDFIGCVVKFSFESSTKRVVYGGITFLCD